MTITLDTLVKFTQPGRYASYGRGTWPEVGKWREDTRSLHPGESGLHVCKLRHMLSWVDWHMYLFEVGKERRDVGDQIVARQAEPRRRLILRRGDSV